MQQDTRGIDRSSMFYWQVDRPFSEDEVKTIFLERANTITQDDVIRIVESGLNKINRSGKNATVVRVYDRFDKGSVNLVYRVVLQNGEEIIVRIHPGVIRNGYFWVEREATSLALQAGVPTYRTLLVDDSRDHVACDFMLTSLIPGVNMKSAGPFSPDLEWKLVRDTGTILGLLHGIRTEGFGFFDNEIAKNEKKLIGIHQYWSEHILAALHTNLKYLRDTNLLDGLQIRTVEQLFSKYDDFIYCDRPTIVQNDVADWNELTDGEKITGLVDWDECYSGDPVCEFAAWSVFYPLTRMDALKNGYQDVRPLPDGFNEKFHIYRLRYIVSKLVGRKKKLMKSDSTFIAALLSYGMEIFQEEIQWFTRKSG